MLNFLVKIATYLDSKNHHKLAQKLDDLAEKLAQDVNSLVSLRSPLQEESSPEQLQDKETLESVLNKVMTTARSQVSRPSIDAPKLAEQMISDMSTVLGPYDMPKSLKPIVNKLFDTLNLLANNQDSQTNPMQNTWVQVSRYAADAIDTLLQGAAGNINKSKARKPNALIMNIQKNLGIKPTGYWTLETNTKFITMMTSLPEYAKYMVPSPSGSLQFDGTLQQAAQFTTQIAIYNKLPEPAQQQSAPEIKAPQSSGKSKWHQMTPAALESLDKLEKHRPGSSQDAIDAIDKVPSQTQQDFEDALKDMADSAAPTLGKDRFNETYRRQ